MKIIKDGISINELKVIAENSYGNLLQLFAVVNDCGISYNIVLLNSYSISHIQGNIYGHGSGRGIPS